MTDLNGGHRELLLEGAKAEGRRLRELIEASGGRDEPIDARPAENEQYFLEVDFRDGEVSLRNWGSGNGRPVYVWEGDGAFYHVKPSCSQLALAALLEERPELVAALASDEYGRASEVLDGTLDELGTYWVMEPEEWFESDMPEGNETDEELFSMSLTREGNASGYDNAVYLPFSTEEAFEWLKQRRDEARAALEEADAA